jgi:hypothetical protein
MFSWRDNYINYLSAGGDPYWYNVVFAQNFEYPIFGSASGPTDSSSNNYSVTLSNLVVASNLTPFGGSSTQGSLSFTGSPINNYVTFPSGQAAFTMGTGAWTVEFWFNLNFAGTGDQSFIDMRNPSAFNVTGIEIDYTVQTLRYYTNGGAAIQTASGLVTAGNWYHFALCKSGTSTKMFLNGTQVGSTYTDNNSYIANTPLLGVYSLSSGAGQLNGYMSNLRIVKGTAVYTANFTPPSSPLTAISGTSYLMNVTRSTSGTGLYNNYTLAGTDLSTNTFTPTGTIGWSGLSPFGNSYPGSFSLISQGAQSLTVATNAAFTYGTGDFTIECWVRFNTIGTQQYIIDQRNSGTATAIIPTIYLASTNVIVYYVNGAARITGTVSISANTWYAISVVKSSGSTKLYVNGTQDGSTYTDSNTYAASRVVIGTNAATAGNYLNGYITNVRLVKGTAVYSANYTPSSIPLTAITNTSLLLVNNGGFQDVSSQGQLITTPLNISNPSATTALAKFGNQSSVYAPSGYQLIGHQTYLPFGTNDFTIEGWVYRNVANATHTIITKSGVLGSYTSLGFNGTSQYVYTKPTGSEFNLSTGDFTIEFWIYPTVSPSNSYAPTAFTMNANGTDWGVGGTGLRISQSTVIMGNSSGFTTLTFSSTIATNAWTHVAVVRSGSGTNNVTAYHNGVSKGTATYTGNIGSTTCWPALSTSDSAGTGGREYMTGYFSDWRIVKGYALYTSTFTPPTTPLTAVTGTSLLVSQNNVDSGPLSLTMYGTNSVVVSSPYSNTVGWTLQINSSNQLIWVSGTTTLRTSTTTIGATTWTYFTISRTSNTTYMFINGALQGTSFTDNGNYNQTNNMYIGADRSIANGLNGYIDDLRITNGVGRYTAAFTSPSTTFPTYGSGNLPTPAPAPTYPAFVTSGVVFYVDAGNSSSYSGSGSSWLDLSGNNWTGTISNATYVYTGPNGVGSYFNFNGTNSNVNFGNVTNANFGSGDFTITFWMYATVWGGSSGPWGKKNVDTTNATAWHFYSDGGIPTFINGRFGNGSVNNQCTTAVATGVWTMYTVIRSGSGTGNLNWYINGSTTTSGTYTNTNTVTETASLYAGYTQRYNAYFNGRLSVMAIYNRAISTTENAQNFNATAYRYF